MEPIEPDVLMITEAGTIDDLVKDAARAGHPVTPRLVHDWIAKGLIDRPERRRVGRTGSLKALHSPYQRTLFVELLYHRSKGFSIRELAEWPVGLWMNHDEFPTRQALRALRTWVGDPRSSKVAARHLAALHTSPLTDDPRLGTPQIRRELLHCIQDIFYTGRIDEDLIRVKASPIFKDKDRYLSVAFSRKGIAPADVETLILLLKLMIAGGQSVSDGTATEMRLERARYVWRRSPRIHGQGFSSSMMDLISILAIFAIDPDTLQREPIPVDASLLPDPLQTPQVVQWRP